MDKTEVRADAIRGIGQIEAVTISSVLNAGDASTALFCEQLSKPLSNDEIELMLSNQAIVLNAIGNRKIQLSNDLTRLASSSEQNRQVCDRWLKDGFKALELSRKCLTALNEVRNPKRSTFIKQQLNQLNLGDHDGSKTVDRIAESKTESFNPNLATLETLDGCDNPRG
ncbi:hypothetical protein [Phormidium tenue]|jgi:hypothetical protein|uniref:Uncharacterized protein n=1 Tax=Phormidium tenue FACHB-1050 TaxID=2692857 RepID=A0ABR8CHX3_9CYAN|nr:hypothetical protein [Phormidium tenue]MBD2319960.1 hypothetical protein [Phormidium tenue FACHB-1050]